MRRPRRESTPEIGMQQMTKSPDRSGMAKHGAKATILSVLDVA